MERIHVVFGATGSIGSAIVRRLVAEGEFVRAISRDPEEAQEMLPSGAGVVGGDASTAELAIKACRGATVVYDCINVRFSRWAEQLPQLTANVLQGARKAGARLVFPDGVFGYGPLRATPATEDHPLAATGKKGVVRADVERMLMAAHKKGDVSVVIPRFPDVYGPFVTGPLVRPMFVAAVSGKAATWPVDLDVPHDMVFSDDAADAVLRLASTDSAYGQAWHVPGAGPITGRQFLTGVFSAAGRKPDFRAVGKSWYRFFGYFIPDAGEMAEFLHHFAQPLVLNGDKFANQFPDFQYTPHHDAIRKTVEWYRELLEQ